MKYYDNYAPIVTWFAIRLMIVFGFLIVWFHCQVDCVMANPQGLIKMDMFMKIPHGIHLKSGNT